MTTKEFGAPASQFQTEQRQFQTEQRQFQTPQKPTIFQRLSAKGGVIGLVAGLFFMAVVVWFLTTKPEAPIAEVVQPKPAFNVTGLEPTADGMIMDNGALNYDALLKTLKADLGPTGSSGGISRAEVDSIWTEIAVVKGRIRKLQR